MVSTRHDLKARSGFKVPFSAQERNWATKSATSCFEGTVLSRLFSRSDSVSTFSAVSTGVQSDSRPLPRREALEFEGFWYQAAWRLGKGADPIERGPWGGCHGGILGCHTDSGGGGMLKGKFGCHGNCCCKGGGGMFGGGCHWYPVHAGWTYSWGGGGRGGNLGGWSSGFCCNWFCCSWGWCSVCCPWWGVSLFSLLNSCLLWLLLNSLGDSFLVFLVACPPVFSS